MNWRNPVFTATGNVDVELEHPTLGWIPFTASPNDSMQYGRDIFAAAQPSAKPYTPPVPDPAVMDRSAQEAAAERINRARQTASDLNINVPPNLDARILADERAKRGL
jgi:hypothetical protein